MANPVFFWLGILVLCVNKIRYSWRGYHRPRTFSVTDIERVIAYDTGVINHWESSLVKYTKTAQPFVRAKVLEIGVGADLGVGHIVLARGATAYIGVDKNRLIDGAPDELCERLTNALSVSRRNRTRPSPTFMHDPEFRLRAVPRDKYLIVSNASFEHVDNVPQTLTDISRITSAGSILCLTVDLQTHTRILRNSDPLNIYRYPSWLYRWMHFPGIPNRVRPWVYEENLKKLGWSDIRIVPDIVIKNPKHLLHFRASRDHMEILQCTILAKRL
jgi:hypothetical protein